MNEILITQTQTQENATIIVPKRKSARRLTLSDLTYLQNRLDSQSKRINKLQDKLAQTISNQRYYLQKRLPNVLKRERAKIHFTHAFKKAEKLLGIFNKQKMTFISNSKNGQKRIDRQIGFFTPNEMLRLRRFLMGNHSYDYLLYRADNCDKLNNRRLVFLTRNETKTLKKLLCAKNKKDFS